MTSNHSVSANKLDGLSLGRYWTDLSSRHLSEADEGLAAICYAGMPYWFNRFLDVYQRKAMARLLAGEDLRGAHVLDIGTGVGRWARWFSSRDAARVVGIDLEDMRLSQARGLGGEIAYLGMAADGLAFRDESFDVVNTVTVLQHVQDETKRGAIAEFARILRPGGRAVVFEISSQMDDAAHVFPWTRETWKREFAAQGFELKRMAGDQYTPLLRAMKTAYTLWKGPASRTKIEAMKSSGEASNGAQMLPLHLAVILSYPIEEVMRFFPLKFGRITGFLFQKPR